MTSLADSQPSVLLVTDNLKVGGVQRVVVQLADGLTSRGRRVGVLAGDSGELWAELPVAVARHPAPSRGGPGRLRYLWHARELVRREGYTVVHAHQRGVALMMKLALAGRGVPVVEHVHTTFFPRVGPRFASFRSDLLIACGTAVREMLVRSFRRGPDRVVVVLNGVADPAAPPAALPSADRSRLPAAVEIVAVGRLTAQKDPLRFVRVVEELAVLRGPGSVHATWVGDGELADEVAALIADRGLEDVVALPGARHDVAAYLARADVLLMTSAWEGLPLVALEAMAAARGVVAPDVGSCADVVEDGVNGILYPPGLTDRELAARLAEAFDPARLGAWSLSARSTYERRFTLSRVIDETSAAYDLVLARRG